MAPPAVANDKAPVSAGSSKEPLEIHIEGWTYNITDFAKRHPGGSVIAFYKGMDATDVFNALHHRSKTAKKWLETLPRRKLDRPDLDDGNVFPVISDFRKLQSEFEKEGLYESPWGIQIVRALEVVLIYFLCFYFMLTGRWVIGALFQGLYIARTGLVMHDMGHRAWTGNMKLDRLWQLLTFSLWLPASPSFWNNQHNKHHAATQELEADTDLETLPLIAFNSIVAKRGHPFLLRFQWLFFIPAQLLLFFYWKFTHTRHTLRTKHYDEFVCNMAHHLFEIYLMWDQGFWAMATYVAVGWSSGGVYLATVFAMNHTHKPVVPKYTRRNWVIRAAEHTTNIAPTPFVDWFLGYLDYQIEHHLFPDIPHPNLPKIAPRVKALFAKHNIPYDCRDIGEAFQVTIQNLYDVGHKHKAA